MNPRLRRLQADYELVREVFSGHPRVRVQPVGGRLPPTRYRIEFRLRGLHLVGDRPGYRELHTVDLTLPLRYPAEKPYAVPLAPIFHPNIREFFCIADHWSASTSLTDVIVKLGDMIQWRTYNILSPLDPRAASWAAEQEPKGLFPVDDVDLGVADVEIRPAVPRAVPLDAVEPIPVFAEPVQSEELELARLIHAPARHEHTEEP